MRKGARRGTGATLASPIKLTQDDPWRADTYPGMAHWGGSDAEGRRCIACAHFVAATKLGLFADEGYGVQGHCLEYQRLTKDRRRVKFPARALACKHFQHRK